jgi:hypothetical protein
MGCTNAFGNGGRVFTDVNSHSDLRDKSNEAKYKKKKKGVVQVTDSIFLFFILIWEFSWSKTKNLNTVVKTKMFESVLSDVHF